MVATTWDDSDDEDNIKQIANKKVVIGRGYSEDVKILKPVQQPKLSVNIPKMNSRIAEDKLKIFIDFKF